MLPVPAKPQAARIPGPGHASWEGRVGPVAMLLITAGICHSRMLGWQPRSLCVKAVLVLVVFSRSVWPSAGTGACAPLSVARVSSPSFPSCRRLDSDLHSVRVASRRPASWWSSARSNDSLFAS